MDKVQKIIFYTLLFIAMLAVMFVAGKYVQRIPPKIAKRINQISFVFTIASGILFSILHNAILLYLSLAFLVCFFIFYNYKEKA